MSTIHKAKGKEFDDVFLLLLGKYSPSDDDRRLIYAAITRAKTNLSVRYNGQYRSRTNTAGMLQVLDRQQYQEPQEVALDLGCADTWLNFPISGQKQVAKLRSGDALTYRNDTWFTSDNCAILKVSQGFTTDRLNVLLVKGYVPAGAKVNFAVRWPNKELGEEFKIVLPQIHLTKGR